MPYKDQERKRQWEREHRAQRNARRKKRRISVHSQTPNTSKPAPDPISQDNPQSAWKAIPGFAVGIGIVLLAVFAALLHVSRTKVTG